MTQQAIIPEIDYRNKIRTFLNVPTIGMEELDKLKSCFVFKKNEDIETSLYQLEFWMKGVIESLNFSVNHKFLVLSGTQGIGKTYLIRHLLPKELQSYFCEKSNLYNSGIYDNLISNDEDINDYKFIAANVNSDNFKVFNEYTEQVWCDKRLTSFCGSSNCWNFPQRKEFLVLELRDIKWEIFNKVDMMQVWRELYNKYKTN